MPDGPWSKAVILVFKASGRKISVNTASEAFELLLNKWPTTNGRAFLAALQICAGVEEGLYTPAQARLSFVDAAREASVECQH